MPDTSDAPGPSHGPETDARWHLEPYNADVDDAPKGDGDDCTGGGDPVEGDENGAP
jgi:hypothetical protein